MCTSLIAPLIIAGMFIFSILAFPALPEQVPSHWNTYGEIDSTMPKAIGAFIMPVFAAVLWGLMRVLPYIDPKRVNYSQFSGTLTAIILLIVVFFAFMHALVLGIPLGWPIDLPRLMMAGVSAMFVALGVLLPKISAQNYFVGIRTPWTLEDPEVWRLTHQFGGVLFAAGGVAGILGALVLPPETGFMVIMAVALLAAFGSIGASWWIYRRLHPRA